MALSSAGLHLVLLVLLVPSNWSVMILEGSHPEAERFGYAAGEAGTDALGDDVKVLVEDFVSVSQSVGTHW